MNEAIVAIIAAICGAVASIVVAAINRRAHDTEVNVGGVLEHSDDLQADNHRLREELHAADDKIAAMRRDHEALYDTVTGLRAEMAQQSQVIESLLRGKNKNRERIAELTAELAQSKRRIEVLERMDNLRAKYITYLLNGIRRLIRQILELSPGAPLAFDPMGIDDFALEVGED